MKHIHAEFIKLWADGAEIEYSPKGVNVWYAMEEIPMWHIECRYRVKPAAPKWPQTTMTNRQINNAIGNGTFELVSFGATETGRRVINKGIEHECTTGALVPADKVREIEAKARAEGVASVLDPVDVINEAWRYLGCAPVSPEDIQVIMRRADK